MANFRHILVPLDQSSLSEAALAYALPLAQPGGVLTLLNVIEYPVYMLYPQVDMPVAQRYVRGRATPDPSTTTLPADDTRAWKVAHRYLEEVAQRYSTADVMFDRQVVAGGAAERILDIAVTNHVDLIVMTTHGRSGLSRWMFGSVAQKVVTLATCPVFLVPQRTLKAGGETASV